MKVRQTIILFVFIGTVLLFYYYWNFFSSTNYNDYVCKDCNVILISVDSLRYDHLGINGYGRNITPNLDNFAKNAVFFPNFITQSYLTPISEASIHTSQYPSANGFVEFNSYINPETIKLEDILKIYNYQNYAFIGSGNFIVDGTFYQQFSPSYKLYKWVPNENGFPLSKEDLNSFKNQKFFLWLALGNIHRPYGRPVVPQKYIDMFVDRNYSGPLKDILIDQDFLVPIVNNTLKAVNGSIRIGEGEYHLTEKDKKYIIDNYDSGIKYTDDYLGSLLEEIRNDGLMENTIIVILSEHGEELGDRGMFHHGDIYDNGIHTFLAIYDPAIKRSGINIQTQVQGIDVMPTILDILGISVPQNAQGKSIIPLIFGNVDTSFNKYVFSERTTFPQFFYYLNVSGLDAPESIETYNSTLAKFNKTDAVQDIKIIGNRSYIDDVAVRTNDWKLIYRPSYKIQMYIFEIIKDGMPTRLSEYQLFYLVNDSNELNNLDGKGLGIENELKGVLLGWQKNISSLNVNYVFNRTIIPNYTFV